MTCPLQLATGVQPDLSQLHVFGAPAWSRLTMQERPDKLHALGIKGMYVGLARGYKGAKILIRDAPTLQQGKLGNKPTVHIHEYSKLGIDMKVDDAALYRLGRKLLPTVAASDAPPASYPRKAPEPTPEIDPPDPPCEQALPSVREPSDEGAAAAEDRPICIPKMPKARPRREYVSQRVDGAKWVTRQSSRVESALISHATESGFVSHTPSSDGMGAYFSTEETVTTMQLGDVPE
jgi:hypothetical protein